VRADAASLPSDKAPCPRISRAASLPLWPGGVRLRGDLNGDGYPDRISVRYAPKSRASCGFLLVAKTRAGVPAMRLPEWYKPPQDRAIRNWPFAEPYLVAVVRLEVHRSQVVVARSHGASVANMSIHGIVGGRLVQLRFHPRFYRDELSASSGRSAPAIRTSAADAEAHWFFSANARPASAAGGGLSVGACTG
jgi:hypothetical protein